MNNRETFARVAEILAHRADHGRLLWTVGARRCYARTAAGTTTLTLIGPAAPMLVYIVEGVDLDRLR